MRHQRKITAAVLTLALGAGTIGCESKAANGALIGGAGGALIGGIIGNNTGNGHTAGGALIGGAVGAIGGGLIGHSMDESDRKEREASYTTNYDQNYDQYGNRKR